MKRAFVLLIAIFPLLAAAQNYDVVIRNGRVIDGSGNPWFSADIGIVGDRIVFVGRADSGVTAKRTIDATGLVVAPGFIDMLGQSEQVLLVDRSGFSKVTQGVTTEITGEGETISPMNGELAAESKDFWDHYHITVDWRSLNDYFMRLQKQGMGINLGTYVGATQVREAVIGRADRAPTPAELERMKSFVDDAMSDGALGLSSALIYAPASYSKTGELIELARVAASYGGIYATHIRGEADNEPQALDEAFRIGREAKVPVEIFHLKAAGRENWGKMPQIIAMIEKARAEGLDVTADQYPYTAGAAPLSASIPPQFHAGGIDAFMARLKEPTQRAAIRQEIAHPGPNTPDNLWVDSGGPTGVMLIGVLNPELKKYEGKYLSDIAKSEHKDPIDELMDLVIADHDNSGAAYFIASEDDLKYAMKQPFVSVGTDHPEVTLTGPLSDQAGHPRGWGSFPRILGKYVREEHLMTLEYAIRKFTSLPAQREGLQKRGLLRPDYFADITIFNPDTVADRATYENPHQQSVGIEYVLVNGVLELEHGKMTGQVGGRPLRGPGYWKYAGYTEGEKRLHGIQGMVTDEGGWPVLRAQITVSDATGKKVASMYAKPNGRYELALENACLQCTITAARPGFASQSRTFDYNGANALSFSFSLEHEK